tara:strand:- start:2655 stop:3185 length:531 start_codon:yes stop_codon:yes gene_type:complete
LQDRREIPARSRQTTVEEGLSGLDVAVSTRGWHGRCRAAPGILHGKTFDELSHPKSKDPPQIASNENPVYESPAGRGIIHFVDDKGAAVDFGETVSVMPIAVRAADLNVHKLMRRIPFTNFGLPFQRYPVNAKLITNPKPVGHYERARLLDSEPQRRRSQLLQVRRFREECEHCVQ